MQMPYYGTVSDAELRGCKTLRPYATSKPPAQLLASAKRVAATDSSMPCLSFFLGCLIDKQRAAWKLNP